VGSDVHGTISKSGYTWFLKEYKTFQVTIIHLSTGKNKTIFK